MKQRVEELERQVRDYKSHDQQHETNCDNANPQQTRIDGQEPGHFTNDHSAKSTTSTSVHKPDSRSKDQDRRSAMFAAKI